jgi:hypothetical protein
MGWLAGTAKVGSLRVEQRSAMGPARDIWRGKLNIQSPIQTVEELELPEKKLVPLTGRHSVGAKIFPYMIDKEAKSLN